MKPKRITILHALFHIPHLPGFASSLYKQFVLTLKQLSTCLFRALFEKRGIRLYALSENGATSYSEFKAPSELHRSRLIEGTANYSEGGIAHSQRRGAKLYTIKGIQEFSFQAKFEPLREVDFLGECKIPIVYTLASQLRVYSALITIAEWSRRLHKARRIEPFI